MKAMVCTRYGPPKVLALQQLEKPVPQANEIGVKVHASTVSAGDCEMRSFAFPLFLWIPLRLFFGLRKPRMKILGQEFSGEIESVGNEQTLFQKGDRVFGSTELKFGANADYLCLPSSYAIVRIPEGLSYEEAATIPAGGMNALFFLRKAKIQAGQKVLITGAAGSIGTMAVQLAKNLGAEVTAVDRKEKLDMLLSIGADKVIDFQQEDFTGNGETYDVIFDIVGKSSFSKIIKSLKPRGVYLMGNPSLGKIFQKFLPLMKGDRKIVVTAAEYKVKDLRYLSELLADGKIKAVIDQAFPLEQLAQAHHYVESGAKKGNVVISHH